METPDIPVITTPDNPVVVAPDLQGRGQPCGVGGDDSVTFCDPNAHCSFNSTLNSSLCVCKNAFEGDGLTCRMAVVDHGFLLPLEPENTKNVSTTIPGGGLVLFPLGFTLQTPFPPLIIGARPGLSLETPPAADGRPCGQTRCHADAHCLWDGRRQSFYCQCRSGYSGDGQVCSSHQECHVHGACVYSRTLGHYHCQCRPPYFGDGRNCVSHGETCDKVQNCDRNADCVYRQNELGGAYLCRCKSGFSGDGYNCKPSTTPALVQCNILNTCSPNAQCVYAASGNYVCQCKTGYKGDGYRCEIDSASVARHQCRSQEDCHVSGHCVNRDGLEDYFCECLPGFKGDGVNVCEPSDQCNPGVPTSTCGQNAHCSYDDLEHAYICKCDQGYYGDGRSCQAGVRPPVAMPPVVAKTCRDDPSMCHRYAACSIDQSGQSYSCRCNTGYRGDGVQNCEQERERAVCSSVNICDKNARCETNNMGEYECRCNPGYEGDGLYCRRVEDCLQNLNMCDRHAECVPDVSKYVCRCKPGYHGSGTRCTADEDLRDQSIVFAQGMSLVLRGLKENDTAKNLIVVPQQIAVGLDFDCRQTKLFWTDVTGHALRSANADGSNVTLVTDKGLESPEGVAVDPTSGNIYYADSQSDIIGVIRSDGTFNYPLIKDGLVNPRALAIDFVDKYKILEGDDN
uniref:EGF-like domain-containing protein n=1 Tax=Romanomermis culicivorax TaxID=13658 RepID=A0A915JIE6_ROMCU